MCWPSSGSITRRRRVWVRNCRSTRKCEGGWIVPNDVRRQHCPDNQHVREKIRQQLQVLRDGGFIECL
ncbi:MAG: hypothetical protein ABW199_12505, partial [Caulobacterales bacterium]